MTERRNVEVVNKNSENHRRKLANAINLLNDAIRIRGQLNTAGPTATINDERIGDDAVALFMPADANAAASQFYATVSSKQAQLTISAGPGGLFKYIIIL